MKKMQMWTVKGNVTGMVTRMGQPNPVAAMERVKQTKGCQVTVWGEKIEDALLVGPEALVAVSGMEEATATVHTVAMHTVAIAPGLVYA